MHSGVFMTSFHEPLMASQLGEHAFHTLRYSSTEAKIWIATSKALPCRLRLILTFALQCDARSLGKGAGRRRLLSLSLLLLPEPSPWLCPPPLSLSAEVNPPPVGFWPSSRPPHSPSFALGCCGEERSSPLLSTRPPSLLPNSEYQWMQADTQLLLQPPFVVINAF